MEHVWRTLPLRQIVIGTTIAFLVVAFSETLIFSVIAHLGHKPSFFGVVATLQGTGAIAGLVTAGALVRRLGEVKTVGLGLAMFGTCAALLALPSLPIVLLAFPVAGVGLSWLIVGFGTAVQTRTPLAIQGRVSAASDISISVAQTVSIATGSPCRPWSTTASCSS